MNLDRSCDVIVVGGGAAGTAAAVGAANAGAQTLFVESGPFLGGAATLKNVLTYCGLFTNNQKKQAVFGVADQVLQRLREMGAVSEPIQFHRVAVLIEPESVKYVLDQLCKHAGVQVCLHTMFLSATRNGNQITSVTLHDHQGNHEVTAKAFVDASGGLQARGELLRESSQHPAVKLLRQIPSIGPIRAALLVALLQTPQRFRTKRQLWAYSGFAVETHDSGEYRCMRGKLQRNRERITVRGLNDNHNKDVKNLFKSAAISASTRPWSPASPPVEAELFS